MMQTQQPALIDGAPRVDGIAQLLEQVQKERNTPPHTRRARQNRAPPAPPATASARPDTPGTREGAAVAAATTTAATTTATASTASAPPRDSLPDPKTQAGPAATPTPHTASPGPAIAAQAPAGVVPTTAQVQEEPLPTHGGGLPTVAPREKRILRILRATTELKPVNVEQIVTYEANLKLERHYRNFRSTFTDVSSNRALKECQVLNAAIGNAHLNLERAKWTPPAPGSQPIYYIRITGISSVQAVKRLHAVLAKKKFANTYRPLKLCYQVEPITELAMDNSVSLVTGRPTDTICGALATVQFGETRRVVTIGGVIRVMDGLFAMTAGHDVQDSTSDQTEESDETLTDLEINDDDEYDDDVDSPAIVKGPHDTSKQQGQILGQEPADLDDPVSSLPYYFGDVVKTGREWSLIRLSEPSLAFPNKANGQYLFKVAPKPEKTSVVVLAGASGQKTMQLSPFPSDMRLPSGDWVDCWKVVFDVNSCLLSPSMSPPRDC